MKVCVRNNLGRELSKSDSLLTHAFSTVALFLLIGIDTYSFRFKLTVLSWVLALELIETHQSHR